MNKGAYTGDILASSDSEDDYESRFSTTLSFFSRKDFAALTETRSGSAPPMALVSKPLVENDSIRIQAMEQTGSRLLQHTLATGSETDRLRIVEGLMPSISAVIADIFGNYVVQACLEHCSPSHREALIASMYGSIFQLSLHTYGCRVIQKALEKASYNQKRILIGELRGLVERCLVDQNANHVIQKCIEVMPYEDYRFIIDAMRPQLLHWATHCYGCRVLQRVIEFCPRQALHAEMEVLLRNALDISQDSYGNYVVQHLFSHGSPADRTILFSAFAGNYRRLSKHKFSSNVVEMCLRVANSEQLSAIAAEVFSDAHLFELTTDRYANFVVQKVLEASASPFRNLLISKIQVHSKALRSYPFGRHVLSAVNKLRKRT